MLSSHSICRKKLSPNGPSDHAIVDANMHVIWALGQEPGDYVHIPKSGLEKGSPSIPDFYRPDELKYHGKRNRGVLSMNFFDEIEQSIGDAASSNLDFCGGEWKYPRQCAAGTAECEYFASWRYDENTDMVDFVVQSTAAQTERWTGIGFSDNNRMVESDVVVGYVESNGRVYLKVSGLMLGLSPLSLAASIQAIGQKDSFPMM